MPNQTTDQFNVDFYSRLSPMEMRMFGWERCAGSSSRSTVEHVLAQTRHMHGTRFNYVIRPTSTYERDVDGSLSAWYLWRMPVSDGLPFLYVSAYADVNTLTYAALQIHHYYQTSNRSVRLGFVVTPHPARDGYFLHCTWDGWRSNYHSLFTDGIVTSEPDINIFENITVLTREDAKEWQEEPFTV